MENKVQTKNATQDSKLISSSYQYSGPLPHPNLLKQFDKKTRDKIVDMAVAQSAHRQSIEKRVVTSNIRNESIGMIVSFLLTFVMIIAGAFLVYSDKQVIGFFTIFTLPVFQAKNYYDQKKHEKEVSKNS